LTRLFGDVDGNRGHPSRFLESAGASQRERFHVGNSVFRGAVGPGQRRLPFHRLSVRVQEGDEVTQQF
jgi:hypothetical protein